MKELLRLYSLGCKYDEAYAMADKMRVKLELSFSIEANQKLAELEKSVKGYVCVCVCLSVQCIIYVCLYVHYSPLPQLTYSFLLR